MAVDASRVFVQEGAYPGRSFRLDELLLEVFGHLVSQNCFATFTRVSGLITKIEYFRDIGRTSLSHECLFTYFVGGDGVDRPTSVTQIFYENDGTTEDSRITTTITRDGDDLITDCDSVFTTSESEKL